MAAELNTLTIPQGFLEIRKKWCKGCSLCADICPKGLITIDEMGKIKVENPDQCLGCGLCESTCPDFAIRVEKNAQTD